MVAAATATAAAPDPNVVVVVCAGEFTTKNHHLHRIYKIVINYYYDQKHDWIPSSN